MIKIKNLVVNYGLEETIINIWFNKGKWYLFTFPLRDNRWPTAPQVFAGLKPAYGNRKDIRSFFSKRERREAIEGIRQNSRFKKLYENSL